MALTRLKIDGYGQIELNNVAFRRDGRIEAQCKLSATDFAKTPCENGMILAVDNAAREVKFDDGKGTFPVAIAYTSEHMYDDRANGLKDFALNIGEFLPRLGYLAVGDSFTTNCVGYDSTADSTFTNDQAVKTALGRDKVKTTPVYGVVSKEGVIQLTAKKPATGLAMAGVASTMPDGQFGVEFHVVQA